MKLRDRVAIVTGGASGIGKATALLFAKEGAKVVVADVNEMEGKRVADKIKGLFVKCDVSNPEDVKNLVSATLRKYGKTDIMFNNAGIYGEDMPLHEVPEETLDRIIDVNLKGVFLCSKYVIPGMIRKKSGVIINTASELGIIPETGSPAYCASKAAVIHLTKVMALTYAKQNIRVNCICPGPIDTPLLRKSFDKKGLKDYIDHHTLFKRLGKPEEVANVALFLASDDASFVTGSAYNVDGGESLA
ncbi:MAG: glucose 1-dehydrogenase [Candidatus Aenigmarchaeota archaeon]|nr:glucose 1-dehydrogenase [Candidatus Aenigmarchaeota archaeon]